VKKEIKYYDYFTESGFFLVNKYKALLGDFVKDTEKILAPPS
jgi:hypothetical protein